jgi:DNA-binding NarL/FixJ family response regulator
MRLGVISRLCLSRKGLCALLTSSKNCSIVLDLPTIPEDVDVLRKAQPEVLLLHTSGDVSDFEVVSRLHKLTPKIKILLLLDMADEETEYQAVRAGARGCVSGATDVDSLLKAIDVVGRGDIWVSRHVATRLISKLVQSGIADSTISNGLTLREWEILALLARGSRNKEIANRISVSENTVKTHLCTIYRKINVDCRLAATLYYYQQAKLDGEFPHKSSAPHARLKKKDVRSDQNENSSAE